MRLLIATILTFSFCATYAQSRSVDTTHYFTSVEIAAYCEGGNLEWKKYLERTVNNSAFDSCSTKVAYSETMFTITISFDVKEDGTISNIEINRPKNLDSCFEKEIIAIIKNGPKWVAAIKNGLSYTSRITQQIILCPSDK
jgi:hypothetical protein